MFNISLPTADAIYTLANVILVIGAILALVGTAGVFWSGGIRERYSDERISKNEVEAAQAKAEAAASSLRAAEVERQNIELRLKFANRRINEDQHAILVAELSRHPASFSIEVMGDSESGLYAADVLKTLTDAKWTVESKTFPLGVIWTGLVIFQTGDPSALHLADALRNAGIPFSIGDQWRDRTTIMVGGKPPVF